MITDNQAKEAIKTIAEYCSQQPYSPTCEGCGLRAMCDGIAFDATNPEHWPEYLEAEDEEVTP